MIYDSYHITFDPVFDPAILQNFTKLYKTLHNYNCKIYGQKPHKTVIFRIKKGRFSTSFFGGEGEI